MWALGVIQAADAADAAAQDALVGDTSVELIPFSDLKSRAIKYILELWQFESDELPGNTWNIPSIKTMCCLSSDKKRRKGKNKEKEEETVIPRLHIGHFFTTHSFLLKDEEPPMCIGCDEFLTIKHKIILLTCSDLTEIGQSQSGSITVAVKYSSITAWVVSWDFAGEDF